MSLNTLNTLDTLKELPDVLNALGRNAARQRAFGVHVDEADSAEQEMGRWMEEF